MLMVLNKTWGGFGLPSELCAKYDMERYDYISRSDPRLVELVRSCGEPVYRKDGVALCIVEIPDEATDWEINDYDGVESVIYVVDGKLYHA